MREQLLKKRQEAGDNVDETNCDAVSDSSLDFPQGMRTDACGKSIILLL